MEKLELKHLAPYLPYGLKIHESVVGKNLRMVGCSLTHELRIRLTDGLYSCSGNNLKPILRPLSDLTKEIEVYGEKFVPSKILFPDDEFMTELEDDVDIFTNRRDRLDLCYPLDFWQKLYQWHFDIHSLVKSGLAVDINTL